MQFNPGVFAMEMLQNNPQIANSPMGQQLLNVLQTGDSSKGEQLAMNICQTYGLSKEEAIQQAIEGLGLRGKFGR